MTDILARLRIDAGQLTLAALIQERALAAQEIERLRAQVEELGKQHASPQHLAHRPARNSGPDTRAIATARAPIAANDVGGDQPPPYFDRHALLRLKEVCRLFGVSRATVYKRVAEKTFPAPLRISERSVRWRMAELADWSNGLNRGPATGSNQGRF
jgi:predicted DNA-binding transcriptional regulator AlpA